MKADLYFTCSFRKDTGPLGWRMVGRVTLHVRFVLKCSIDLPLQPLAIQAILVLISLVCLLFSPESPRYLVEIGQTEKARAVLTNLYGQTYANEAIREILEAVELEEAVAVKSWSECFQNNKQCFRYRTLLAVGCNFFQQVRSNCVLES